MMSMKSIDITTMFVKVLFHINLSESHFNDGRWIWHARGSWMGPETAIRSDVAMVSRRSY